MVGNDIVDLKQAALESHWQRKGFINKVFTDQEIGYIKKEKHPSFMVWKLWSMKESAYKINVQQYNHRFFNPKKMACRLLDAGQGVVTINKDKYRTHSIVNDRFVYSIATLNNSCNIESEYFEFNNSSYRVQSRTGHSKLIQAISKKLHVKNDVIKIKKSILGVPKLYKNDNALSIGCSLTNHGNYGAYVFSS